MKTGIELIATERQEQIKKHGFDKKHDSLSFNSSGELACAAGYLISMSQSAGLPVQLKVDANYPYTWDGKWKEKFDVKNRIEKLTVAGALIAAEIDRLINQGVCPQCMSWEGLKQPRNDSAYCEDCGWPDENRI